mmetsp:Transcript_24147/g.35386  ORF Transcript_24147/g.35386 Transcript_24147/m.35386 type:complete len:215 (-) Transcript_24147:1428-2072(-)
MAGRDSKFASAFLVVLLERRSILHSYNTHGLGSCPTSAPPILFPVKLCVGHSAPTHLCIIEGSTFVGKLPARVGGGSANKIARVKVACHVGVVVVDHRLEARSHKRVDCDLVQPIKWIAARIFYRCGWSHLIQKRLANIAFNIVWRTRHLELISPAQLVINELITRLLRKRVACARLLVEGVAKIVAKLIPSLDVNGRSFARLERQQLAIDIGP